MNEITPLMIQYQKVKAEYPEEVLFFRLGDFYEMFDDDAKEVSKLLNLTLTHRANSPMCGIPYHAAKVYIARLLRCGKKIAICEQIGIPSKGKGLTERKVIEIITPGTVLEQEYLEGGNPNFLASLTLNKDKRTYSFAFVDISTGDFYATSWLQKDCEEAFPRELSRALPRELIISQSLHDSPIITKNLELYSSISVSYYPDWHFDAELSYKQLCKQFNVANLKAFGLKEDSAEIASSGFLLKYLVKNTGDLLNSNTLPNIKNLQIYKNNSYLDIDDDSRKNLELLSNLKDGSIHFSLLESVNFSQTAMGKRLLINYFMYPLTDIATLQKRQKDITVFFEDSEKTKAVREILGQILDIERLASRISLERAHAKDLQALKCSLIHTGELYKYSDFVRINNEDINVCKEIIDLIESSIDEDPATSLTEGRLIKRGYNAELDHIHEIKENFNKILDSYMEEEKEKTGIQNLRIKYNSNMGYFIEVSKGKISSVPSHFILKRTLVNGDRYSTERLQELETELLSSSEKIILLERDLFLEIRRKIAQRIVNLLNIASYVAYIDVSSALAYAASIYNWVCPQLSESKELLIENGRHPVVEMHLPLGEFVPNDINLNDEKYFSIITGPNMAGKSTYLRQNALIVFLAQIGSYVPATKAKIGLVDKIFCRVGASDNLARGESTFLVEMTETAHILRNATEKSLVIMDEVGRGTSTEDGLSIAWSVSEYLLQNVRCKTLFATHYHELTRLSHPNLSLLCLSVLENEGEIVFLKKIKEGASENSYGLHVAQLAGIPQSVITRAAKILEEIQKNKQDNEKIEVIEKFIEKPVSRAPSLFSEEELVLESLLSLDVNNITPLEALKNIQSWQNSLNSQ